MVRRGIVMALGLTALMCAAFSVAPTQVSAVDYFTAVGCNYGDYTCLFQRNGVNPNAPQFESPRVYYQSLGYSATPYGYVYTGFGNNFGNGFGSPYFGQNNFNGFGNGFGYGYGSSFYGNNGFFGNGFGFGSPFYGTFSSGSFNQPNIANVTGFCNIGYGQKCNYPR